jgi:UrcA family protein
VFHKSNWHILAAGIVTASILAGADMAKASTVRSDIIMTAADGKRFQVVDITDLNLRHDAAISILQRRLRATADRVCQQPAQGNMLQRADEKRCARKSLERALLDAGGVSK